MRINLTKNIDFTISISKIDKSVGFGVLNENVMFPCRIQKPLLVRKDTDVSIILNQPTFDFEKPDGIINFIIETANLLKEKAKLQKSSRTYQEYSDELYAWLKERDHVE